MKCTPFQGVEPIPIPFSVSELLLMQEEVVKLAEKNVIDKCMEEPGQFVSNIFMVPKQNGKVRIILDLSKFNDFVDKPFQNEQYSNIWFFRESS